MVASFSRLAPHDRTIIAPRPLTTTRTDDRLVFATHATRPPTAPLRREGASTSAATSSARTTAGRSTRAARAPRSRSSRRRTTAWPRRRRSRAAARRATRPSRSRGSSGSGASPHRRRRRTRRACRLATRSTTTASSGTDAFRRAALLDRYATSLRRRGRSLTRVARAPRPAPGLDRRLARHAVLGRHASRGVIHSRGREFARMIFSTFERRRRCRGWIGARARAELSDRTRARSRARV